MVEDVFAAAEWDVAFGVLFVDGKRVLNGRHIDIVVVEDWKGAPFAEHVERLGHQRRILVFVKTQRQLVQMTKDLQGNTPQGLLSDPGKDRVPQFAKSR